MNKKLQVKKGGLLSDVRCQKSKNNIIKYVITTADIIASFSNLCNFCEIICATDECFFSIREN